MGVGNERRPLWNHRLTLTKLHQAHWFRTVFLKLVILLPSPRDIWQCLQALLVVITGGGGLLAFI